ncbi:MAG: MltA domain-containing protein, partial [Pseudomonadota bacterium]
RPELGVGRHRVRLVAIPARRLGGTERHPRPPRPMTAAANLVAHRRAVPFSDLPGWGDAEALELLRGLRRHLSPQILARPHQAKWLASLPDLPDEPIVAPSRFVETHFTARHIEAEGFVTGYYEPIIAASRSRAGPFQTPLYRRPPDLVRVAPRAELPGDGTFARARPDGTLAPYHDRAAIETGALAGRNLELAFVEDPVDAFFAQIQGSARLKLDTGETVRISYHGKSGHPYTAIGRVMIDRGILPEGGATMATIRAALASDKSLVRPILQSNRSFVFFRERPAAGDCYGPIAAGGVPLVPWRSLAVDRGQIPLGTPVYVETTVPGQGKFAAVMIAEDTGSAIVGPARGDMFMGSGDEAGAISGEMKAAARFTLIEPLIQPKPFG